MKKVLLDFISMILVLILFIAILYLSFATDIPTKVANVIRTEIEALSGDYEEYSSSFEVNELTINMSTYYYNTLTSDQQLIYTAIANGVRDFKSEFSVKNYDAKNKENFANELSVAIEAFINDHPEVFYLQSQYSSYVVAGLGNTIGYIKLNYTEDTIDAVNEKITQIKAKISEYTQGLSGLSDYEKELKIHDDLVQDLTYSKLEELPRQYHTAEGALLESTGVCDGFTKALQLIYDSVGIDSIIVLGSLDGNAHAWNLVKIDNEWYHVDITSSRSIYEETGSVAHSYFNLTTSTISNISTIDSPSIIPTATATKYNYYTYNGYVLKSTDNFETVLGQIYNNFTNEQYIEFYFDGNVSENMSSILSALKSIDGSFINGTKMYYYNVQNAIIIPKN